ncbi:MAG: NUDIX domain-containing protein [Candidatus Thermoplasmatota archaeon]|nr:NUDIX domain-containing protein [Candidatus Thermoplasmatota archaeon]
MEAKMEARTSMRVYREGHFLASEGRIKLLEKVQEKGSITAAAQEMGMSYRHAWGMLKKMEEAMGTALVESHRGGSSRGNSTLTEQGRTLLEYYRSRTDAVESAARWGKKPCLTVDILITEKDRLVLVKRKNPPFEGRWALPGGFVEYGETAEEAAVREAREETGLDIAVEGLQGVFSDPGRDPRGHTISVVFVAGKKAGKLRGGDDASEARWFDIKSLPKLAFDHQKIVESFLNP